MTPHTTKEKERTSDTAVIEFMITTTKDLLQGGNLKAIPEYSAQREWLWRSIPEPSSSPTTSTGSPSIDRPDPARHTFGE